MSGEMFEHVQALCPMGCGQTIFVGSGGYLTCSSMTCPRPTAAHEVLQLDHHHRVHVGLHDFTIEHPLRERVTGAMHVCALHAWMLDQDGPPVRPGLYEAFAQDGDMVAPWQFIPVSA